LIPLAGQYFEVVDAPKMVQGISKFGVEYQIACVPWMKNSEDMRNALKSLAKEIDPFSVFPTYMTGHFTVNGAVSGSEKLFSLSSPNGIERDLLKPFRFCFLGDIHKPQMIGNNGMYIGSLDRVDFSERNDEKGSILFTDEWPTEPMRYHSLDEDRAQIKDGESTYTIERRASDAQKFVQIDIDLEGPVSPSRVIRSQMDSVDVTGAVVKISIRCLSDQRRMINLSEISENIYSRGALFVMPTKLDVVKNEEERVEHKVMKETSVMDALRMWVDGQKITDDVKGLVLIEAEKLLKEVAS